MVLKKKTLADYEAEQKMAMDRLYNHLDRQQRYVDSVQAEEAKAQAKAESEDKLNYMDEAMTGTQIGSSFGPWGALAGLVVGRAAGGAEAFEERKRKGESGGSAFANAFLNPWESFKNLGKSIKQNPYAATGTAQSVGSAIQGYKQRNNNADIVKQASGNIDSQPYGAGSSITGGSLRSNASPTDAMQTGQLSNPQSGWRFSSDDTNMQNLSPEEQAALQRMLMGNKTYG